MQNKDTMPSNHPYQALTAAQVADLAKAENLRPLELRKFAYECGCTQERLMAYLAPTMRASPDELFGGQERVIAICPRCGARHNITREAMEAFIAPDTAG